MPRNNSCDKHAEPTRSRPLRKTSLILAAARMEVTTRSTEGMLLWAHTGPAYVDVGDARLRANEGQALWIPPDIQCTVSTPRDSLTIPLPVFTDESSCSLPDIMTVVVTEEVRAGLLWHFTRLHGRLQGSLPRSGDLLALACGAHDDPYDEGASPADLATPSQQITAWVSASAEGRRGAAELPASDTPPSTVRTRTGTSTVLAWVYRGSVRVSIKGCEHVLESGDAIVLPAHIPHHIDAEAGTILLPVVARTGAGLFGFDGVQVARVPSERELPLLHTVISTHTPLRPEGFQPFSEPPRWLREAIVTQDTAPFPG